MEVESLRVFLEVLRRGSFAAVARDRAVAPSSVSRAIAGLEAELGVRLLQRTTRVLQPTEAGLRYAAQVEPVLEALDAAGRQATDAGERPTGVLRVSAPVSVGRLAVAPVVAELAAEHPELRFDLELTDRLVDLVADRRDVAVRLGRLEDSSHVAIRLCAMHYALVASRGWVAEHGPVAHPSELPVEGCLRYPVPGQTPRWRFRDQQGAEVAVPVGGRFVVSDGPVLRDLAVAGVGVALLPRWNVARELEEGVLVQLLPDWQATASRWDLAAWAVLPTRSFVPARVRAFVERLQERLEPFAAASGG
ncbi:MAG: LysR family transcriptional regulator [Myxococcales bacterium]|nr:LysR family transcriptional regulator [Myxococcales bacterium]